MERAVTDVHDLAEVGREYAQQRLEEQLVAETLAGRQVEPRLDEPGDTPHGVAYAQRVGQMAQPHALVGGQRLGHTPVQQHRVELAVDIAASQHQVARMRVAVEAAHRQNLEHGEVVDVVHHGGLVDVVLLEELGVGHLVQLEELHGDDALGAVLVEDARYDNGHLRRLRVHRCSAAAVGLDGKVDLVHRRGRVVVDRREHSTALTDALRHPQNHLEDLQIVPQVLLAALVLHLDGHDLPVMQRRLVDLRDRRACDWDRVEVFEHVVHVAQFLLQRVDDLREVAVAHSVLQLRERVEVAARQHSWLRAQHLTDLHPAALQVFDVFDDKVSHVLMAFLPVLFLVGCADEVAHDELPVPLHGYVGDCPEHVH
ncbi:ExuT transport protein [Babesia caballi]|uniref:ExuT transport protein n=1 Tax=Babesia caballi TaxID=5871 RepID=A0AAV4LLN1_BABCB|nr:ExuT transport protein [Babesia caballi]